MYHDKIVPVNYTSAFERSKGYDMWDLHKGVANAVVALGRSSLQGVLGKGVVIGRLFFAPHISCPTQPPPQSNELLLFLSRLFWFPLPAAPTVVSATTGACASAGSTPRLPDAAERSWRLVAGSKQRKKRGPTTERGGRGDFERTRLFPQRTGFGVAAAGGACFFFSFPPLFCLFSPR